MSNFIHYQSYESLDSFSNIDYKVESWRDIENFKLLHFTVTFDNQDEIGFVVKFDYDYEKEVLSNISTTLDSSHTYSAITATQVASYALFDSIEQVIQCDEKTLDTECPYFFTDTFEECNAAKDIKLYSKIA